MENDEALMRVNRYLVIVREGVLHSPELATKRRNFMARMQEKRFVIGTCIRHVFRRVSEP